NGLTVVKIINSGTFGSGTVKLASAKPTTTGSSATTKPASSVSATPALKKSTSGPSVSAKPTMASRTPAVPPSRRASLAPTKPSAPGISKPSLSSSTSGKPAVDPAATRASVASPTGSVSSLKSASSLRPRASISEGVKRTPVTRPSVSSASKPPPTTKPSVPSRSVAAPTAKARTTSSISSIREVKEDGKAMEDLQNQLKDATELLKSKSDSVTALEEQLQLLESSLEKATAESESKDALVLELEQAKAVAESEVHSAKDALNKLQATQQGDSSVVEILQKELDDAKNSAKGSSELAQSLREQIQSLENQLTEAKEHVESLETRHKAELSDTTSAAAVEHGVLLKAHADLTAIAEETSALKIAHNVALDEAQARILDLENRAAEVDTLRSQLDGLKVEREENSSKLSELEIEILELRESLEGLEDERDRHQARVKSLEDELERATSALRQATEEASEKGAAHTAQIETLEQKYAAEHAAADERHAGVVSALETIGKELESTLAAHEQTKKDGVTAQDNHLLALKEAESSYASKAAELSSEIDRIKVDLEGQEAQYNVKVEAIKTEHVRLLSEAFERAKHEAGEAHAQELQALRASSNSTIEQIQEANRIALENVKSEHASTLESDVNDLQKQITKLNLDLKATQDDLSKSKAALEAARAEIISITQQRDEARALAETAPATSPEHTAEVARLANELSHAKDDLSAVTDQLNLMKASLAEMSDQHARQQEDAATARANEVMKLRSIHDEEVTALAKQKSELLIRLSDLEGELATAKAAANAEASAPKSNGNNGAAAPPSPGVTKEELQRMHEAHNLKIYDLQAEHEKAMKALKEELETTHNKADELQQEVARKAMEIQYLEQDQDENQEQITRYVQFFQLKAFVGGVCALAVIYGFF
ncbi:hypothetical protein BDQ12DRAFT_608825, partial [Crucibulum laeve]